jgi:formamidopyrimidine-DNA glycosylase
LDTGDACVIEPRMTGLMLLADPPDRQHLRLEWKFDAADSAIPHSPFRIPHSLWFWDRRGLGTVRLYSPDEFAAKLGADVLGSDALEMSDGDWRELCRRVDRPIKVALLDQKLVAGIGNLYASEILHRAGIHPGRRTGELKPRHVRRLSAAVRHVLELAIRYEGSTLGDGTYRNALNQNGGYQNETGSTARCARPAAGRRSSGSCKRSGRRSSARGAKSKEKNAE